MKKLKLTRYLSRAALTALARIAGLTARLGAGAASTWGGYQPRVPDKLRR